MRRAVTPGGSYDDTTVRVHWIVAAAVLVQWGGAHLIDAFHPGPPRVDARSVHIVLGLCLLGLVLFRIWWRAGYGARFPSTEAGVPALAARVGHATLYAALLATLALGITDAVVRADTLFGLAHMPSPDLARAVRHAWDRQIVSLHRNSANLLLWLAGGHASVAIAHHVVRRDVLARMVPSLSGRDPHVG